MYELITFNKSGGNVSVHIKISTHLPWRYSYVEENYPFIYSANSEQNNPTPHVYALGYPAQLNFDANTWDIILINDSNSEQDYEVLLEWYQEGNSKPLHKWERKGTLKADETELVLKGGVRFHAK